MRNKSGHCAPYKLQHSLEGTLQFKAEKKFTRVKRPLKNNPIMKSIYYYQGKGKPYYAFKVSKRPGVFIDLPIQKRVRWSVSDMTVILSPALETRKKKRYPFLQLGD